MRESKNREIKDPGPVLSLLTFNFNSMLLIIFKKLFKPWTNTKHWVKCFKKKKSNFLFFLSEVRPRAAEISMFFELKRCTSIT